MVSQVQQRQQVWSRYWAHGASHSCGGSYGNRYEGALAQFWRTSFAALADGARVLDIATGNGPLARLLLDAHPDDKVSCDAVDLAALAPAWLAELPEAQRARVRFHGQQAAEALPFEAGTFDMVVSQYGLEYTELDQTVPELLRVLAPGGKVRLLTHHADSLPVRLAATELAHMAWMREPGGLLETAGAMLEPMARAGTPQGRASLAGDQAANALRERFNALQAGLDQRAQGSDCPDVLMETRQAMAGAFDAAMRAGQEEGARVLAALDQTLSDGALRLQELRDFALDRAAAARLCAALAGIGAKVIMDPVSDQDLLMGWCISVDQAR